MEGGFNGQETKWEMSDNMKKTLVLLLRQHTLRPALVTLGIAAWAFATPGFAPRASADTLPYWDLNNPGSPLACYEDLCGEDQNLTREFSSSTLWAAKDGAFYAIAAGHLIRWTKCEGWQSLASINGVCYSLVISGDYLYLGGALTGITPECYNAPYHCWWIRGGDTMSVTNIAKFALTTCQWFPVGDGSVSNAIIAITVDASANVYVLQEPGAGSTNYVTDPATGATRLCLPGFIKKWNGSNWANLGGGVVMASWENGWCAEADFCNYVALANDGTNVYLGARITHGINGNINSGNWVYSPTIIKWDGTQWQPMGTGTNVGIHAPPDVVCCTMGSTQYCWDAEADDVLGVAVSGTNVFVETADDELNPVVRFSTISGTQFPSPIFYLGGTDFTNRTYMGCSGLAAGPNGVVYVTGPFDTVWDPTVTNFISARQITEWNGICWTSLGGGVGTCGADAPNACIAADANAMCMILEWGSTRSVNGQLITNYLPNLAGYDCYFNTNVCPGGGLEYEYDRASGVRWVTGANPDPIFNTASLSDGVASFDPDSYNVSYSFTITAPPGSFWNVYESTNLVNWWIITNWFPVWNGSARFTNTAYYTDTPSPTNAYYCVANNTFQSQVIPAPPPPNAPTLTCLQMVDPPNYWIGEIEVSTSDNPDYINVYQCNQDGSNPVLAWSPVSTQCNGTNVSYSYSCSWGMPWQDYSDEVNFSTWMTASEVKNCVEGPKCAPVRCQTSLPPTPTGLTATPGSSQVALSWTASSGATGYNVYRSTTLNGTYTELNSSPITATTYTDTTAVSGTTYYYEVSAVNFWGESAKSSPVSATPQTPPPNAPTLTCLQMVDPPNYWIGEIEVSTSDNPDYINVYQCNQDGSNPVLAWSPVSTQCNGTNVSYSYSCSWGMPWQDYSDEVNFSTWMTASEVKNCVEGPKCAPVRCQTF